MGNRACITTKKRDLYVYVHWHGSRSDIETFLRYCAIRDFRPPEQDAYGWARLCQVLSNFFGANGFGVGIYPCTDGEVEDPGDNGIYVIENWSVVERIDGLASIVEYDEEDSEEEREQLLIRIDEAQPARQQLGPDGLKAQWVSQEDLRVGDTVIVCDFDNRYRRARVIRAAQHFGEFRDTPYGDLYHAPDGTPDHRFFMNRLYEDRYRVIRR